MLPELNGRSGGGATNADQWLAGLFSAIDRRDAEGFAGFLAEDVVFRFGNASPVQGRAAAREAVAGFFGSIAAIQHALHDTWRCGDYVICRGVVSYTRLDDSILTVPFANIFGVREGKVREYDIYVDIGALFAA
jgi:ketosteroid isomerase-like protein